MKKLRNGLYAVLNSTSSDSSDYRIAKYLISNIYKLKKISVEDIAKGSFVSKSTVSRFCRRLGYEDYQSMRQTMHVALTGRYHRYDEYLALPKEDMTHEYFRQHVEMLHVVREYATDKVLEQFSNLLLKYENIGLCAQMHAYPIALNFQMELSSYDKIANCFNILPEQESFIQQCGSETLIIVISSSGRYFEDFQSYFDYNKPNRPYLVLVTNNQRLKASRPYDKIFIIPSDNNTASQPMSMQIFTNLVTMHFGKMLREKNENILADR